MIKKIGKKYRVKTQKNKNQKEKSVLRFFTQFSKQDWMPEMIATEDEDNLLITSFIEGCCLEKAEKVSQKDIEEMGKNFYEVVQRIHSISYPAYEISQQKKYNNWYQLLYKQYIEYLDKINEIGFLNKEEIDIIKGFIQKLKPELERVNTTFVHGDLKDKNIIYQPKRNLVYPIDFEISFVGDPDYDWSRILMKIDKTDVTTSQLIFEACINCEKEKIEQLKCSDKYVLYELKVLIEWYILDKLKLGIDTPIAGEKIKKILRKIS